jgi:hypothetical protein
MMASLIDRGPEVFVGPLTDERMTSDAVKADVWPNSLSKLALIGLAGDVVRMIEPHTESDPAALLFNS